MGAASARDRDASILSPLSQAFGADDQRKRRWRPAAPPSRAGVWAPGCGRSRRTIRRDASGQASSARWSVSSATYAPSRGWLSPSIAGRHAAVRQRQDPLVHALLYRSAEGQPDSGFAARVGQRVAGAGRVRAREDRPIQRLAGELLERQLEQVQVVGGVVDAGVARPQDRGQHLPPAATSNGLNPNPPL